MREGCLQLGVEQEDRSQVGMVVVQDLCKLSRMCVSRVKFEV